MLCGAMSFSLGLFYYAYRFCSSQIHTHTPICMLCLWRGEYFAVLLPALPPATAVSAVSPVFFLSCIHGMLLGTQVVLRKRLEEDI